MNLVRNWTQLKEINTFSFRNKLAQIFDILNSLTKLAHCISNFKGVYVISADVQIHDHWIFSFSFSLFLWYKKIYLFTSVYDKLLGPKYRVFVKLSHVKLFLWVKIFNWAQTETSNSSSTVSVVQWYFENRNISMSLWPLFWQFIVENSFFIWISFIFASGPNFDNKNVKLDTKRNT